MQQQEIQQDLGGPDTFYAAARYSARSVRPKYIKKGPKYKEISIYLYLYIYIYVANLVYMVTVWPIYPQSLPCVFSMKQLLGNWALMVSGLPEMCESFQSEQLAMMLMAFDE